MTEQSILFQSANKKNCRIDSLRIKNIVMDDTVFVVWFSIKLLYHCLDEHIKHRFDGDRGYVQNVHTDTIPEILIAAPDGQVRKAIKTHFG